MAAQRRAGPGALADALKPVPEKRLSNCFQAIADSIRESDRPLVHVEDDENGAAVRAAPFLERLRARDGR
jgi:hypothetical protein